jgi:hypothetical protein
MRPADPAAARARFWRVVERAIVRGDERHRAHLVRLRALRHDDGLPSVGRPDADRRQRMHERLLAAARLPRRPDAPTWPAPEPPEPLDATPPALTSCPRCGASVVIDGGCFCAARRDGEA